ncbi:DUF4101 domain-containing protein [Schaalia sp. 19OD2882]|uniref:IMS domain-containing protein n=1 Tax=Schaalia sp. 19OD2882 TaxID=2794089 RepID=UPI001C1F04EC|nr:IMS domain-containing protein [Schaalia sp. 19OD2882]QWW19172.1 DUF4101 domain-containing protein [Schaalia sp. 19OD2882]
MPAPSRKLLPFLGVGLALVIALAVGAMWMGRGTTTPDGGASAASGASADASTSGADFGPSGDQAASAAPPAPPAAPVSADGVSEQSAVQGVLERTSQALAQPNPDQDMTAVLAGDALDQHLALAAQYQAEGMRVSGHPKIVSSEVLEKDGARVTVLACVDSSGVTVTDDAGQSVGDPSAPTRSRMLFTLEQTGGTWKLVHETFPEEADC